MGLNDTKHASISIAFPQSPPEYHEIESHAELQQRDNKNHADAQCNVRQTRKQIGHILTIDRIKISCMCHLILKIHEIDIAHYLHFSLYCYDIDAYFESLVRIELLGC